MYDEVSMWLAFGFALGAGITNNAGLAAMAVICALFAVSDAIIARMDRKDD